MKPKGQPKKIFQFYSQNDSTFDRSVSKEFTYNDANNTILLYRVDIVKSKVQNLYGEAKPKDKKILAPIQLDIILELGDLDSQYKSDGGVYEQRIDSMTFGVFIDDLLDKKITINRGDYYTYNDGEKERIYEITVVSNIDSKNSLMGDKPLFKVINGTQVKEDVVLPS